MVRVFGFVLTLYIFTQQLSLYHNTTPCPQTRTHPNMSSSAREEYDKWLQSGDKSNLRTCILRLGWNADQTTNPGKDRSHWTDVEVVAGAIERMPGPKPSWEWMQGVARTIRGEGQSNYRLLTHERNIGIDRDTAQTVLGSTESRSVSGHARSKVEHQVEWLVKNKDELPEGLVRSLGDMLADVEDADTGASMLDRRRISTAGRDFRPGPRQSHPTTQFEVDKIANGIMNMSLSGDHTSVVAEAAVDGGLRFNRDGSVDQRSALVRDGTVLVRDDGKIDGRSSLLRQPSGSASSSTSAPGPRKADGTPDMRYAANRSVSGGGGRKGSGGGGGGGRRK